MARTEALLRLHERLIARRDLLRKKVNDDSISSIDTGSGGTDVGDAASEGSSRELNSQLMALESRELAQVERSIQMIREGRYGMCEMCESSIPIARMKALPYTQLCVECQRLQEESGRSSFDLDADWESAFEHEGRMSDRELNLKDIQID
ncbi:MAG: TraR/DksA C4-type zinc finger protein [Planctomycetaceae bacterium]|nr:TraR/DksA C4-type zinc finger protein [Planctomycetaceae bacterium]